VLSIQRHGVAEKTVSSRFADNRSDKILARNRLRIIIHNRSPMVADVGPECGGSAAVVEWVAVFHPDSSWTRKG